MTESENPHVCRFHHSMHTHDWERTIDLTEMFYNMKTKHSKTCIQNNNNLSMFVLNNNAITV
jgi:hypothetical protein